jgi:hypothetical protein
MRRSRAFAATLLACVAVSLLSVDAPSVDAALPPVTTVAALERESGIPSAARPIGVAIDPVARRVYVANSGTAALSISDMATNRIVKRPASWAGSSAEPAAPSSFVSGVFQGAAPAAQRAAPAVQRAEAALERTLPAAEEAITVATRYNYRDIFFKAFPEASRSLQVHHTLPQRFESLLAKESINVHELQFLRGVDRAIHGQITNAWGQWQRQLGRMPSAQDVLEFAAEVEGQYGQYFIGP